MVQDEPNGEVVAASSGATREKKLNFFQRIALFIRQVIAELRKVVTPTWRELVSYTVVVLAFVAVLMAVVYVLDLASSAIVVFLFGNPNS